MPPITTFVLEASGRDLRVPADVYQPLPLGDVADDVLAAVVEPDAPTVVRRLTDYGSHIDNDFYVVLPVAGPWSILEVGGELRGVAASEHGGRWFAVLASAFDDWPGALPMTTFVLGTGDASWEADAWRLRPHPLPIAAGRDWRWRGIASSFGPHVISVVVDASRDELARFWASCAPVPFPDDADLGVRVHPERQFAIADGRFSIVRGHSDPGAHVRAFDRGLLCALARGAAGPPRWWRVLEQDWQTSYAMGDGGQSLIDYLFGEPAAAEVIQARMVAPTSIDASAARDADAAARAIAAGLGASDLPDDAAFDAWLAVRPLGELPRVVEISVPRGDLDRWARRLHAAQPFIAWRVSGR